MPEYSGSTSNLGLLEYIYPSFVAKVKVKAAHSCLTLSDPMDCIAPGILQARILEWIAFPFSRGSSQPRDQTHVSHIASGFFTSLATREVWEYWLAYPFSRGSSRPRNQTGVSCIAGRFFTNWVIREAPKTCKGANKQTTCLTKLGRREKQVSKMITTELGEQLSNG